MKINFLGDSITEGMLASSEEKTFVSVVGRLLGAEVRNHGIGGTRIAKSRVASFFPLMDAYFASRVRFLEKDADFIVVFGGVNDFGEGDAPIGNDDDKTPDTFKGALNNLLEELLKCYSKEQIIFILPLHCFNENSPYGYGYKNEPSLTLDGYVEIMRNFTKRNNLKCLDIREEMGPAFNNPYFEDGLHPSDAGHQRLGELIANYIKSL